MQMKMINKEVEVEAMPEEAAEVTQKYQASLNKYKLALTM